MSEARLQRALKIQREGKKIIRNFCDFWISPQTSHAAAVFVFVRPRSGASWSSSQQSTHNDDKHEPVELKFKDTKSGAEECDDIFFVSSPFLLSSLLWMLTMLMSPIVLLLFAERVDGALGQLRLAFVVFSVVLSSLIINKASNDVGEEENSEKAEEEKL